jgi:beta-lactamase regulating signal transducer with metallopeptidase domain
MTSWLAETFVTTTLLLLLVLALRAPVARAFGAGWAYALWAVPALRLFLPPLPQLVPELHLPAAVAHIPAAALGGSAPLPVDSGPGDWLPLILAVWAGGAVIFLTLEWLSYRAFLHRLEGSARPARPPSHGGIDAVVSEAVDGPLAMGLLHPRIVLPADFERRYSPDERRLALAHEITHHRRGDIWWNCAATLVLAFNWFNPVAWIAYRAFRADQELSCDAAVAARASAGERCDYARALVKSASRPGLIAACALNSASQLKHRLRMMRGHKVSGGRRAGGLVALSAVALAGFAVGNPAVTEAAPEAPLVQVASAAAAAAAVLPQTAAPDLAESAPATARRPAPPRAKAAPRRHVKSAPAAAPVQLAAVAPEAAPLPETPPEPLRIVRVETREVHARGPLPGPGMAQFVVFRTRLAAEPRPAPEIARAIKAARAGDLRVAAAHETLRTIRIRLKQEEQGE